MKRGCVLVMLINLHMEIMSCQNCMFVEVMSPHLMVLFVLFCVTF